MDRKTKEMYSQVDGVLRALGKKYIEKIPTKLLTIIQNNTLEGYRPEYTFEKSLLEQGIKRESLAMIALLHLNYWCETEEQRNDLKALFAENTKKNQEKMHEQYSSQNMFARINEAREQQRIKEEELRKAAQVVEETIPEETPKEGFFKKLFKK